MHAYSSFELRRILRDRRYLAVAVVWPVASYLLFSSVFGAAKDRAEGLGPHTEIMVAMATFGAIGSALVATGPRLAAERREGWLRQLAVTPLRPPTVLAARVVTASVSTLPAVSLTFLAAAVVKGVGLAAWEWPTMAAVLLVGSLPFCLLGLLVGTVAEGDAATGLTMALYVSMGVLGGLWVPPPVLPAGMRAVALGLPSYRLAEVGWDLAAGTPPPVLAVAVIGAWLAGAALLAAVLGRRMMTLTL